MMSRDTGAPPGWGDSTVSKCLVLLVVTLRPFEAGQRRPDRFPGNDLHHVFHHATLEVARRPRGLPYGFPGGANARVSGLKFAQAVTFISIKHKHIAS